MFFMEKLISKREEPIPWLLDSKVITLIKVVGTGNLPI